MWFLLACVPTLPPPTATDLVTALRPEGWARAGCAQARSEGVATTACTLERAEQVAVVTVLTYDRTGDAERSWSAADGVGWRDGRVVVQVDVLDRSAARDWLETLPEGEPVGFACVGDVCQRDEGARRIVVGPDRGTRPAPGYVVGRGRTVGVLDRSEAERVLEALPRHAS